MPAPKLRAHRTRLVGYCLEGLSWAEMQDRLRVLGTDVALSTILRFCGRHGFSRLHPRSQDYSPDVTRQWLAGKLGLADLNRTKQ